MEEKTQPSAKETSHLENVHIPLWLFKDTCWMLKFKLLGASLIAPTITVALIIAWRTRHNRQLFLPNLAVSFWICANSSWMLGEFFEWFFYWPSLCLFLSGILSISWYFTRLIRDKIQAGKG